MEELNLKTCDILLAAWMASVLICPAAVAHSTRPDTNDPAGTLVYNNTPSYLGNALAPATGWSLVASGLTEPRFLRLADINRDGKMDLCMNGTAFSWWQNQNHGQSFVSNNIVLPSGDYANFTGWQAIDFDNNGRVDIVAASANLVFWLENGGKGTNWITHVLATNLPMISHLYVGDVDGSGGKDVVVGIKDAGKVMVLLNATGPVAALTVSPIAAWGNKGSGQTNVPAGLTNVVAIAAGDYHDLALRADGQVRAWGNKGFDDYGQATVPAGLSNVVAVAGGSWHSLALRRDGQVVAWGLNGHGQTTVPAGLNDVVAIAGGGWHSLALRSDGRVVAWGNNGSGQTTVPAGLSNVVAIAAGENHSLALRADGQVVAWGNNGSGQTTVPVGLSNVVAIAAGGYHNLALQADTEVVAWGRDDYGEATVPAGLSNVVAVAAGGYHSLALRADGRVAAWGSNDDGQTRVPAGLSNVVAIAGGWMHSLALTGTVPLQFASQPASQGVGLNGPVSFSAFVHGSPLIRYQWVFNGTNVLGANNAFYHLPNVQPGQAGGYAVVVSNATGSLTSQVAVLAVTLPPQIPAQGQSQVGWWGNDTRISVTAYGQPPLHYQWYHDGNAMPGMQGAELVLSRAQFSDAGAYQVVVTNAYGSVTGLVAVLTVSPIAAWGGNSYGQTIVPAGLSNNLVALAAGRAHNLGLRMDGTLAAWGYNDSGQTEVPPGLSNVLAIAAGGVHSMALKADGSVVAWGDNWAGQATVPSGLSNAVAFASGGAFNLALQADGTVVGWGDNNSGQTNIPAGLRGVIAIAAGGEHALALKADGTVAAWGLDDYDQTQVPPGLSNVVAIAAGYEHSLALKADGILICWGNDHQVQTLDALQLTNVVAIAAGGYHSLALKRDGTLASFGFNEYGQTNIPAGLTNVVAVAAGETHSLALVGPLAPWLLTPVPDRMVNSGDALCLQARVNGSLPLSYQWYQDGSLKPGATNSVLQIPDARLSDAGSYYCIVSNAFGSVTSRVAAIRVAAPPEIVQQPLDRTSKEGTTVVLTMTAVGTLPMYYQWYKSVNNLISNATNSAFNLQPLALANAGDYFCVVSNAFGCVTSLVSRVTVIPIGLPEILINGRLLETNGVSITNAVEITLRTDYPGGIIYYSLDGSDPLGAGVLYERPFTITNSVILWVKALNSAQTAWQEVSGIAVEFIPYYTLQALAGFGGQVSGSGGSYLRDTEVTVTAVSSNGWAFVGWSGDATGTNNPLKMVMTRDKIVQAIFGTSLMTTPLGGGTVTRGPDLPVYPYGSTVRLTALPNSGNYFKWWGGAAAGQSNSPLVFTITNTTPTVSALFALLDANYFSLNVLVQGQGEVLVSPIRSFYANNTPVTLTATPAADWTFTGWRGASNTLQNPLVVLMNSSKVLTAVFRTNTPNDLPPSVALVAPANNAEFYSPADIAIEAIASDSDGQVATVGFYALAAGATSGPVQLGVVSKSPYRLTWTNASLGNYLLTAMATDDLGVSTTSAPVSLTVSERVLAAPVFSLSSASYQVAENAGSAMVTVLKNPFSFAASVNYSTGDGTARAITFNQTGDYEAVSGVLYFGTNETTRTLQIPIEDDASYEGNQTFTFNLVGVSDGASLGQPSQATVTIVDDDPPASTNSITSFVVPARVPAGSGSLRIYLEPPYAGGQWRFLWETAWRNSGTIASELVPGNYPVEFKPVSGFLEPAATTNIVTAGTLTVETNAYSVDAAPQFGALSVVIQPSSVANAIDVAQRGQWRLQGATNWLDSGGALSDLVAGNHIVEFKTVPGFSTPPGRVAIVASGQENGVAATYLLSASAPGSGPSEIASFDEIRDSLVNGLPFCFDGQLLSDVGYGSGVVVKRRVVLTAAHVVFNDASLSYVDTVWWFFQRHRGEYEPIPQQPRGWYVYSGYAAQRANDNSPGVSSPASQNMDVAALYFTADAGRGGYGGYLTSDAADNEWLMSSALKILVGYPVETVLEEDRGRMHWVAPGNYGFAHVPGAGQAYGTMGMKSYPGNSGGPLCVLYSGKYYPAGVYLGGSGQSVVRAIDGGVVDLINRAEVTANTGDNNTGGGVITVVAGASGTGTRAYLKVRLGPAGAVTAGAAWRLQGETTWLTNPNTLRSVAQGGSAAIEFREVAGWLVPTNRSVTLVLGQTAVIEGDYIRLGPGLSAPTVRNGVFAFGLTGQPGMVYVLEASTNLARTNWLSIATNSVGANSVWQFADPGATNLSSRYYRAKEKQ